MKPMTSRIAYVITRKAVLAIAATITFVATAHAAAPGIAGVAGTPVFNLIAQPAYLTQPDGQSIYSWGYGCSAQPSRFLPSTIAPPSGGCPGMQVPGPTLIVTEGDSVTVNLTNSLPAAAGNTSILFSGFQLASVSGGTAGLMTQEAAHGATVT